jgi:hypothetical protein
LYSIERKNEHHFFHKEKPSKKKAPQLKRAKGRWQGFRSFFYTIKEWIIHKKMTEPNGPQTLPSLLAAAYFCFPFLVVFPLGQPGEPLRIRLDSYAPCRRSRYGA